MRYLITGASGGLGRAVCDGLEWRAATSGVDSHIQTIGRQPGSTLLADLSTCTSQALTDAVRRLAEDGPFHGIVHCAGAEVIAPLRLTSDDQYRTAMMAADSAFAILRAAAKKGVMAEGGSIVLMSSVAAHRGTAGMVAYSAGKAAIEAMVRCAAVELAPRRIRVNAVAAGAFRSPMHERIARGMSAEGIDAYSAKHPLGFGSVDAVRDAVLHLLSPGAHWVTGAALVVDGGYLA